MNNTIAPQDKFIITDSGYEDSIVHPQIMFITFVDDEGNSEILYYSYGTPAYTTLHGMKQKAHINMSIAIIDRKFYTVMKAKAIQNYFPKNT